MEKKKYEKPELIKYGDLKDITGGMIVTSQAW